MVREGATPSQILPVRRECVRLWAAIEASQEARANGASVPNVRWTRVRADMRIRLRAPRRPNRRQGGPQGASAHFVERCVP